jgi:putative acetyltransferase
MMCEIRPTAPDDPVAMALIAELNQALDDPRQPPASRHGYSVARLVAERVAFFVAWCDGAAAGCAGLAHAAGYGEVKRMYVRPTFRRRGVAQALLAELATQARAARLAYLRLETGIWQHDAIALYERAGFTRTGPFGPYREDPFSVYFGRAL